MRSTDEQWRLGDEALKAEPIGRSGPRGGVGDRIDQLADEWGVEPKTLRILRGVAHDWPKGKRNKRLPWSVHAALRQLPDDVKFTAVKDDSLTVRSAQALVKDFKRK
jgi:hypothetical protein